MGSEPAAQAGVLITVLPVLPVPVVFPPFPEADVLAILLQLDGSTSLHGNLRGIRRLLPVEPLHGVLVNRDLPLLRRHKVQLLEHTWKAQAEPCGTSDGNPSTLQLLQEALDVQGAPIVHGGADVLQVVPHSGVRGLGDHEGRLRGRPRLSLASPVGAHGCHVRLLLDVNAAAPQLPHVRPSQDSSSYSFHVPLLLAVPAAPAGGFLSLSPGRG